MGIWGLIGVYIGIDVGSTKDVAKNWNLGGDSACKKKTDGQQKMYTNGDVSYFFSSMLSTRVGL